MTDENKDDPLTIHEARVLVAGTNVANLRAQLTKAEEERNAAQVLAQDLIAGVCRIHDADPRYDHGCEACDGRVARENAESALRAAKAELNELRAMGRTGAALDTVVLDGYIAERDAAVASEREVLAETDALRSQNTQMHRELVTLHATLGRLRDGLRSARVFPASMHSGPGTASIWSIGIAAKSTTDGINALLTNTDADLGRKAIKEARASALTEAAEAYDKEDGSMGFGRWLRARASRERGAK